MCFARNLSVVSFDDLPAEIVADIPEHWCGHCRDADLRCGTGEIHRYSPFYLQCAHFDTSRAPVLHAEAVTARGLTPSCIIPSPPLIAKANKGLFARFWRTRPEACGPIGRNRDTLVAQHRSMYGHAPTRLAGRRRTAMVADPEVRRSLKHQAISHCPPRVPATLYLNNHAIAAKAHHERNIQTTPIQSGLAPPAFSSTSDHRTLVLRYGRFHPKMKFICYTFEDKQIDIRPASAERSWIDDTRRQFAKRCLPLMVANAHGWQINLLEALLVESEEWRDLSREPEGQNRLPARPSTFTVTLVMAS